MNTQMKRVARWKSVVESLLAERTGLTKFRRELARAEAANELSEFYVLSFHAIASMIDGSEFAQDYLEMAEAVASSPCERALAAENWAAYELQKGDLGSAADRCLTALESLDQTAGLWKNLLLALDGLGQVATIDFVLRRFARLRDKRTAELVQSLATQPALGRIHARPAFRDLVVRRCPSVTVPSSGLRMDLRPSKLSAPDSMKRSSRHAPVSDQQNAAFEARLMVFLRLFGVDADRSHAKRSRAAEDATFEKDISHVPCSGSQEALQPSRKSGEVRPPAVTRAAVPSVEPRDCQREQDELARAPRRSHDCIRRHYRDMKEAVQYGYIDLGVSPVETMDWGR